MTTREWSIGIVFGAVLIIGVTYLFSGVNDGIELGRDYPLAYTYLTHIKQNDQRTIDGRIFDMADRSLPKPSILVPLRDERGVALTMPNASLKPNTIRKVKIDVPEKTIEGTLYPAYSYIQWQYNTSSSEVQTVIPTVTPAK